MDMPRQCPKCHGRDLLRIPDQADIIGFANAVLVTRCVCMSCGFSEQWIDDPEQLQRLVKKFGHTRQ